VTGEVVVPVRGPNAYDVIIDRDVAGHAADLLRGAVERVLIVHAAAVAETAREIASTLEARGIRVWFQETPDAEAAKTVDVAAAGWALMGQAEFTRSDAVITVGGGATTDIGGFIAATWLRGVQVVHVATTLLGMVDAAVGGKTGINTAEGKNLVGSFHPPAGVVCDLATLQTLPIDDLRAGLAEAIKCGFIADPVILDLVEEDPSDALDPNSDRLKEIVRRAVAVKAEVVSQDLKESGLREILNYGHTFAHAIELIENYQWRHGDAVAVGCIYAAELAQRAGILSEADVARHRELFTLVGLPTQYLAGRWDELLTAMRRDKKTRGTMLRFVVLNEIGEPTRLEGPSEELLRATYDAVSA